MATSSFDADFTLTEESSIRLIEELLNPDSSSRIIRTDLVTEETLREGRELIQKFSFF
jgi:hypothetical protein